MKKLFWSLLALMLVIVACVPKRQLDDMEAKYIAEKTKRESLASDNLNMQKKLDECQGWMSDNKRRIDELRKDTAILGNAVRRLTVNYDQLDKTYRELLDLQDRIKKGSDEEAKRYLRELERTSEKLQEKEDKLGLLQKQLEEKENSLNELSQELSAREMKVKELQSIIDKKDSATNELKKRISAALLGFENKGLTVTLKNGKVYVSLENELLFKSGSYTVGEKGQQALKQLAAVLNENNDINITVEGHTDTDKFGGSGSLKDNWDLSVIRATQIVKILESYKVDSKRLIASGRGEYLPLDSANTGEAKQKNRRTEIILTPNLDELYNLLEK